MCDAELTFLCLVTKISCRGNCHERLPFLSKLVLVSCTLVICRPVLEARRTVLLVCTCILYMYLIFYGEVLFFYWIFFLKSIKEGLLSIKVFCSVSYIAGACGHILKHLLTWCSNMNTDFAQNEVLIGLWRSSNFKHSWRCISGVWYT